MLSVIKHLVLGITLLCLTSVVIANEEDVRPATERGIACDHYSSERQVFFGDTHVHTGYSFDASLWDTRIDPFDAYYFAKGGSVGAPPYDAEGNPSRRMQLERPLDFAVVTDHAESLGIVQICKNPLLEGHNSLYCRLMRNNPSLTALVYLMGPIVVRELRERNSLWSFLPTVLRTNERPMLCGSNNERCRVAAQGPWQHIQQAAEVSNDLSAACTFTSFIGYEWTGLNRGNLHRNVIFRNRDVPSYPVSFNEAKTAPDLWKSLDESCVGDCEALVIPHNSNLSLGEMFPSWSTPIALNDDEIQASAKYQRIMEIMQHKGDSECWYGPGVEDELCAFEKLEVNSLMGTAFKSFAYPPLKGDGYARGVLNEGLRYQRHTANNPYRLGFIASSDTHLGTPGAVEESTFIAHTAAASAFNFLDAQGGFLDGPQFNPGGLAAVWAEENSRDALFKSMKRREVYGTSGPRIVLRFFASFDYADNLCDANDAVQSAYTDGVPMGGIIDTAAVNSAPKFMVMAAKDSGTAVKVGSDLQRLQIIKGWLDERGKTQQQVYDIAGDANNGAKVDLATCNQSGPGATQLCAVWRDPDFNPKTEAWYYARAVENPSCRWSQFYCNARGVDCNDTENLPAGLSPCCTGSHTIQERAWSSPIWYVQK